MSQQYNTNKGQPTLNKYNQKYLKRKHITIDDYNNRTEDYYNNKYHSKSMEISAEHSKFIFIQYIYLKMRMTYVDLFLLLNIHYNAWNLYFV